MFKKKNKKKDEFYFVDLYITYLDSNDTYFKIIKLIRLILNTIGN